MSNTSLELPRGIKILNDSPLDSKFFNKNNEPYTDVNEVLTELMPETIRHKGLFVFVDGLGLHWFKNGTTDGDLVPFDTGADTLTQDIPVILEPGINIGKYINGDTIPCQGWTFEQLMIDLAQAYVAPILSGLNVSPQATTVEVGTTLSGSKTFSWNLTQNSGQVATVDIFDITAGSNLATGVSSVSPSTQTINTIQLNSDGANQSWRLRGINGNGADIVSNTRTVTSRYMRYWGATANLPSNMNDGTANRTYGQNLPSSGFQTGNTFTLVTGTVETKMVVLLPPGKTISSVIDTTNLNADITSNYVQSTITVKDVGGTDRTYNMYTLTLAGAYSTSANHVITTN